MHNAPSPYATPKQELIFTSLAAERPALFAVFLSATGVDATLLPSDKTVLNYRAGNGTQRLEGATEGVCVALELVDDTGVRIITTDTKTGEARMIALTPDFNITVSEGKWVRDSSLNSPETKYVPEKAQTINLGPRFGVMAPHEIRDNVFGSMLKLTHK